jgi:hypothetical protein
VDVDWSVDGCSPSFGPDTRAKLLRAIGASKLSMTSFGVRFFDELWCLFVDKLVVINECEDKCLRAT